VILGLDDSAWRAYGLAEAARRRGETLTATADGNPFASELAALAKRGVSFFVCDNALDDWATYAVVVQGAGQSSVEQVRDDLRRRVVPSALLVPAGVVALNQAQEARFTYVQGSL
jgi:intracellular sulfur oxidation DsrE/DsrF family protein